MGKSMWCVVVALVVSCGGGGDMDGGPGIDGSIDAPVAACSGPTPTATCAYVGYGTMCPVPCSFPETCSFEVGVNWTGAYCCRGLERWVDCRCVDGTARCARYPGSTERVTPTTTCEFCAPPDAGG